MVGQVGSQASLKLSLCVQSLQVRTPGPASQTGPEHPGDTVVWSGLPTSSFSPPPPRFFAPSFASPLLLALPSSLPLPPPHLLLLPSSVTTMLNGIW